MNFRLYLLLIPLIYVAIECNVVAAEDLIKDEAQAIAYLNRVNTNLATEMNKNTEAEWNYATDIRDSTAKAREEATKAFNAFQKEQSIETKKYDWTNFEPKNKRQFEKLAIIGTAALTGDDEQNYIKATSNMETTYSTAKVCLGECTCNCNQELDPHLNKIMAESKDYALLEEVWTKWRDVSGKLMRKDFIEYYTLGNKAATLNKLPNKEFKTLDDLWLFPWETPDIKTQTEDLWKKLNPFYEKLHAYVRKHLKKAYPDKLPTDGTIPAHLLGNMWAQQWSNIMNTVPGVDPYPDIKTIDVTEEMVKQEKTAKDMFDLADKFFGDLGLERMTQKFWDNHASAWDFYTTAGDDFRIKQCTNINMEDLITVHHEMGHIEYFMQYKNQPVIYRDGANAGFHEAIGDLLALSVSTPNHLKKIGLLTLDSIDKDKVNIKYQLKMALDKLAFLPFGFIMDKYRWDVFSGTTSSDHLNKHWWELRGKYQGLSPPVKRSEDDFDPGAKYHIPASVEYIRYFVSHLLQFQFHKALCSFSQKDVPLYECDIDGDREAGAKLKAMLELGSSKPWPEQLKLLTGSETMDVQPLLDYFQPLSTFLDQQLVGEPKGWEFKVDDYVGGAHTVITSLTLILTTKAAQNELISDEKAGAEYLASLESKITGWGNKASIINWAHDSDINEKTLAAKTKMAKEFNAYQKQQAIDTKKYDWSNFLPHNKRQFEKLAIIGTSALDTEDEKKMIKIGTNMEKAYSTGRVCVKENCMLELDPDLYKIMADSKDYDELLETWVNWRNATGKKMRKDYISYVGFVNKAAKLNELPNRKFETFDDLWLFSWETPDIKNQTESLLNELMPFYRKLHAYVRKHLKKAYPGKIPKDGTIPAHILGNMWAQQWSNTMKTVPGVDPYPKIATIDVTKELLKQNYTAKRMFEMGDKFFQDLGLQKLTDKFWEMSILEKIPNKEMVCHASAWDFSSEAKDDYRIKMCTNINMVDFITIHHELGHIQYYMQYADKPASFREGANPGFHEAIGDLLALSVSTPKHLQKVKLLKIDESVDLKKITIKYQMKMALDKLAVLPWAFLVDKWRWDVMSGEANINHINKRWWELRGKYQGVSPPVKRSESDLDPGAKYHIPFCVEYIRYFVSHVLQFQFHKALCSFSQKDVPLYECDIDGDKEAGDKLKNMLTYGSSELWPLQLKQMTGTEKMDVQPLLEYFQPLQEFLDNELKGEKIGWDFNVEDYFDNSLTFFNTLDTNKKRKSAHV
ncbi:unnamed protein product [Medioppia subpectinata]|uniref:Angiotensin-converting enzyme n=1 Tax=Medioppia subpectinata TaxID=1979941 RepID=A0A7R9KU89_9ACAR|nr:unnamed protein product [Medioppia subpectinata]CAG2109942.1 unnamed protein product [Medioppia subpectinata]